jgi:hypothetical protein
MRATNAKAPEFYLVLLAKRTYFSPARRVCYSEIMYDFDPVLQIVAVLA